MEKRLKIAVGMSGGVDSSLVAWLLKQSGHEVLGLTLRLGRFSGDACGGPDPAADAAAVCAKIGIPHRVAEAEADFAREVVSPFVAGYAAGLTPSPCMVCNRRMKFGTLLELARSYGCDKLATGHYVRLDADPQGRPRLRRGSDPAKDQSYFLAMLTPAQLASAWFPLGDYRKEEVKALAAKIGLMPREKPESQDLCFLPDGDYARFVAARRPDLARPGEIVDLQGRVLGRHRGFFGYTIGQRKGLGLSGGPWFVVRTEPASNRVVVGREEDLASREFRVRDLNWQGDPPSVPVSLQVRYAMKPVMAAVEPLAGGQARVVPETPLRGVTPGQGAVFYDQDWLLGGGWIAPVEA